LALVLVALAVLGTVGYVVYAQTAQTQSTNKSYLARVAEKLGVTEDALTQAMYEAKVEMIDEAVAEGKLTKAQADYLKAVLKAKLDYYKAEGYEKGFGFGPGFGMRGFGRGFGRGMRGFGPCWQAPATNGQYHGKPGSLEARRASAAPFFSGIRVFPCLSLRSSMERAVEVKNLVKVYGRNVRALDGVDLSVEAGKTFALLGPNGAGKTTLVRILTTQIRPTSGEAFVFGLDVVREGGKVRKIIGYVPQEMSVWTDLSGYENLLIYAKIYGIPRSEREKLLWEVLEKLGMKEAAKGLVRTYSGGMIRRLEIASALLIRPKILFLDEPTIGLDPSARKAVWTELGKFKEGDGVTIFFNTHYMDEADLYAEEIGIINAGKIVTLGTAAELKRSVGGELITLTAGPNGLPSEKLRSLEFVEDVISAEGEVRVVVRDAEAALPKLLEFLRQDGISVARVSMTKPTLDDVFLKYAGTKFEAGGRVSEVRQMRRMIRRG